MSRACHVRPGFARLAGHSAVNKTIHHSQRGSTGQNKICTLGISFPTKQTCTIAISFPTKQTCTIAKIAFGVICSFVRCFHFTSSSSFDHQPCPRPKIVRLDLRLLLISPTARAPATAATVTAMMTLPSLHLLHSHIRPIPSRALAPAAMPSSCRPIPKATAEVTSQEPALRRHLLRLLPVLRRNGSQVRCPHRPRARLL